MAACAQVGDAALVRVALHAPSDGHVALGSVLSGTLDFRASQEAAALNPEAPRCVQVRKTPLKICLQHSLLSIM